jgi:uncharacterized integral membrane protein
MRKLFAWMILAPAATLLFLFAMANRRWVTLSIDPFSQDAPAYAVSVPLFLVILGALIAGVLIGGIAVWFGKMRWRMAAHRAEREAAQLRTEKASAAERARTTSFSELRGLPPGNRDAAA